MNATNYVLTTNLAENDMLYQISGKKFQVWNVSAGGEWVAPGTVTVGTNSWENAPVANLPYGDAVILVREPSNTPFYLVGQCPLTNMTCSVGPGERKMLANLSYSEVNMNELPWSVQPSSGDVIEVLKDSGTGFDSYFRYVDGDSNAHWGTNTYEKVDLPDFLGGGTYLKVNGTNAVTDVTFQPGTGFWYKNNSADNTPALQWTRSN